MVLSETFKHYSFVRLTEGLRASSGTGAVAPHQRLCGYCPRTFSVCGALSTTPGCRPAVSSGTTLPRRLAVYSKLLGIEPFSFLPHRQSDGPHLPGPGSL